MLLSRKEPHGTVDLDPETAPFLMGRVHEMLHTGGGVSVLGTLPAAPQATDHN